MKNQTYQDLFETALEGDGKLMKGFSNFHTYSFGNQMLAIWQMSMRGLQVSPIATFKKWQTLGRQVQKGQKAIELIMPVTIKDKDTDEKKVVFVAKRNWFALSQTEGKELEFPEIGFDYDKALQTLGISKEEFNMVDGNIQGYARKGKILAINPIAEMPEKTLFHEIAHIMLGHTEGESDLVDEVTTKRNIKEVEAESVALCMMLALGLEGIEYPRGYIKNWLQNDEIPAESIKKVFRVTNEILRAGQEKPEAGE